MARWLSSAFASDGKTYTALLNFGNAENLCLFCLMRQNKIAYMVLHGRIRTGADWWFSKILRNRTGSDSICVDQDWTRTEKSHSLLISDTDWESWHRRLKRKKMLLKILNEWLCNVQFFRRVWILKISRIAFRISLSVFGVKRNFWLHAMLACTEWYSALEMSTAIAFRAERLWKIVPCNDRATWLSKNLSRASDTYHVDVHLMMNHCKTQKLFGSYCYK